DAGRVVETAPFGAQGRRRVPLAADFKLELGQPLCLERGVELDFVDISRRRNQHGYDEQIEDAKKRHRALTTASREGRFGTPAKVSSRAGAAVRSAARSLADRARG